MNLEDDGISNPTTTVRSRTSWRSGCRVAGSWPAVWRQPARSWPAVRSAALPPPRGPVPATAMAVVAAAPAAHDVRSSGSRPVPVADANGPEVVISSDYTWAPLIPWGTPIRRNVPAFSWPPTDPEAAENQIGIGHDGMWYFGTTRVACSASTTSSARPRHVLGKALPESADDVRIMQAVHGVSCVAS